MYSLVLTCLAAPAAASFAAWNVGQSVKTSSGVVQGHAAKWPAASGVSEYLGIPYALPPTGPLRWAPPQPYIANRTFAADKYSSDCFPFRGSGNTASGGPDLKGYGIGMGAPTAEDPHKYDEDCLGINIWTKPQSGEKSKAVLLWIYGGAFTAGTAHAPYMNGGRLAAEEDVVVVSFNYRVSLFGFPKAPGLKDLNPGLLDQRLAVEWVRDNIEVFGGDPKRIVLFGESAGGASVDYYSFAWTQDPIVTGFIPQSGSVSSGRKMGPADNATQPFNDWYKLSETLGCGGVAAGEKTLACMRGKPAAEIMDHVNAGKTGFGPMADGRVVFSDYKARSEAGNFIKKPMLVGNNDNEAGLTAAMMGAFNKPSASPSPAAAPGGMSDATFSCPAGYAARVRAKAGVPVWRYRYHGEFENTRIATVPGPGAYHSAEIPLVFGATELRPGVDKDTPEEAKLSKNMRHAWAEFAKDPINGLKKLGWPVYDESKNTLIRLGYNNASEPNFGPAKQYDGGCASLGIV